MSTILKGLEFDPGFAPYILEFRGSVEYLYREINRFKNMSQKKMRFMQFYKKILEIFNNNLGFYVGCLMWAAYIKSQPKQELISNHCYGLEYDEEANTSEIKFMLQFVELFSKDVKYFLGQKFSFDESVVKLLKVYEEFLIVNKGFVSSKFNDDILLPSSVKIDGVEGFKAKIDDAIKMKDLSKLLEYQSMIME